ncbi:MAG: DUF2103 domain-containing protein [Halobacteriaceae archaeon]
MECGRCGTALERPGDFCLSCDTANCDAVVVEIDRERADLTMLADGAVVGQTAVTTVPEPDAEREPVAVRNYVGRIADEVRRKRPDAVFGTGDRERVRALRTDLHHEVYRVPAGNPVETARERRGQKPLEVVEKPAAEKISGAHSTLIGGREGRRAVRTVAAHPNVKRVVPGPIEAGGSGSRGGRHAKVTRAGTDGNVRLLLRDGSSVQENRVVTTAGDREGGERVRDALGAALDDAGLSPSD